MRNVKIPFVPVLSVSLCVSVCSAIDLLNSRITEATLPTDADVDTAELTKKAHVQHTTLKNASWF